MLWRAVVNILLCFATVSARSYQAEAPTTRISISNMTKAKVLPEGRQLQEDRYVVHQGSDLLDVPANVFVASQSMLTFPRGFETKAALTLPAATTELQCFRECWLRAGEQNTLRKTVMKKVKKMKVQKKTKAKQRNAKQMKIHRGLSEDHCTWLFWAAPTQQNDDDDTEDVDMTADEGETKGVCHLFHSGKLPGDEPSKKKQKLDEGENHAVQISGTLAFVAFPRRFDLYRTRQCDSANMRVFTAGGRDFTMCAGAGKFEGTGTFCLGADVSETDADGCAATGDTMLDAAHYFERESDKTHHVQRISSILTFGESSTTLAVQGSQGANWEYTLDPLNRVTQVRVVSTDGLPDTNLSGRDQSPSEYQALFNYIMQRDRQRKSLQFDAGHLVPASQSPPNHFFNYVPQNAKSNRGGGCWWFTETAVADLMRLGYHMSYDIDLTYRDGAELPKSATCEFRYRPKAMGLNFQVKGWTAGTACATFGPHFTNEPLMAIGENEMTVTRVMAYFTQKWIGPGSLKLDAARGPPKKPALRPWKRLMHVATTMAGQCDSETGAMVEFAGITLTPEFTGAFLSSPENDKCIGFVGDKIDYVDKNRLTWSYESDGVVVTKRGDTDHCMIHLGANIVKLQPLRPNKRHKCVILRYKTLQKLSEVSVEADGAAVTIQTPAKRATIFLENLVTGALYSGESCFESFSQTSPTTGESLCLPFRVSYYPIKSEPASSEEGGGVDDDATAKEYEKEDSYDEVPRHGLTFGSEVLLLRKISISLTRTFDTLAWSPLAYGWNKCIS